MSKCWEKLLDHDPTNQQAYMRGWTKGNELINAIEEAARFTSERHSSKSDFVTAVANVASKAFDIVCGSNAVSEGTLSRCCDPQQGGGTGLDVCRSPIFLAKATKEANDLI
jgi:hypothetical protein